MGPHQHQRRCSSGPRSDRSRLAGARAGGDAARGTAQTIRFPTSIFVATSPVNLHLSFDRLAGIVREHLGSDPRAGALYVFHNRCRTQLKLLWHNTRGYCILYVRLEHATYGIPLAVPPGARSVSVSVKEMALLLDGIDRRLIAAAKRDARASAALHP